MSTGELSFTGVRRLRIIVATETDFVGGRISPHGDVSRLVVDASRRCEAAAADWNSLYDRHLADHRALYDRMSLDLGGSAAEAVSTAAVLSKAAQDGDVRLLASTVFAFGRYLTIAGIARG